jgi:hypothetical protein
MREADWLVCTNPESMLLFLRRRTRNRKFRLFACAYCRRTWNLLRDERSREAVEIAERFADGLASRAELYFSSQEARRAIDAPAMDEAGRSEVVASITAWRSTTLHPQQTAQDVVQEIGSITAVCLFRELFGNPFRRVALAADLSTSVLQLAEALYAGEPCHFALHDALLEAGHPELAGHFHEPEHPKGCWALDLILGKA